MLTMFQKPWREVPICFIDTETTGLNIATDRACEVGFARFEAGVCKDAFSFRVNPGMPIPTEATAVHGITDKDVEKAPTLAQVFALDPVVAVLENAQLASFNWPFDRHFLPIGTFPADWPGLDCLSLVRVVDKFAKGKGRHKLSAACERHGIKLEKAHSAGADARAAGELFYKLAPNVVVPGKGSIVDWTLGQLLCWQAIEEAKSWYNFNLWRSQQPPLHEASNG